MTAQELRIGNWVVNVDEYWEVRLVDFNSMYIEKSCPFKPIPLTEEWLLKFGFKFKSYGYGDTEWKQWSFNGYSLNSFTCNTSGVDVKYLHQLQNLYFALTGEELKVI